MSNIQIVSMRDLCVLALCFCFSLIAEAQVAEFAQKFTSLYCLAQAVLRKLLRQHQQTNAVSAFKAVVQQQPQQPISEREKQNRSSFSKPVTTTSGAQLDSSSAPTARLLATGTFRSNMIKLWETATNRKLRDLSSSGQTSIGTRSNVRF